jgi:hypothetical protein
LGVLGGSSSDHEDSDPPKILQDPETSKEVMSQKLDIVGGNVDIGGGHVDIAGGHVDICRHKSQKVAESRRKSQKVAQSRTESHRVAQSRPWGCEAPACGRSARCQQHMSPLWPTGAAPQGWRPRVERESEVGRVARQRALGQTHLGHTLPPAERVGRLGEANTCERKLLRSKTLRRSYLHFPSLPTPSPRSV